jgi:hypothetical protein
MSDSDHRITFNKVQPGTPGAQALNNFIGTNAKCRACSDSVPVTASDVAAYTSAHGQPQPTDVFAVEVQALRVGPKHGTGP